eukprot:gene15260-21343_t
MPSLAAHYSDVSKHYETAFFYDDQQYHDWLMERTLKHLDLPVEGAAAESARIVDLGGGTGKFTEALQLESGTQKPAICVDAFAEMLKMARVGPRMETLHMDAVAFSKSCDIKYTHVLMKELLHHIPLDELPGMFKGIYESLPPGGIALTITRPQEEAYPFFQRAREIWRENQAAPEVLTSAMEAGGFEVEVNMHAYKVQIPKVKWLNMIRGKFWSTFSLCSPVELANGLKELETEFADTDLITFHDLVLFIVARKPQQ